MGLGVGEGVVNGMGRTRLTMMTWWGEHNGGRGRGRRR